jgi:hypothetical protein
LLDLHDDIEEELVDRGIIAVIEYPNTQEKFLAIVAEEKRNLLKEPSQLKFQLVDNQNETLTSAEVEKYVIFRANREGIPALDGVDYYLKKLVNIIRKMEKDLFMSEKRLVFISPEFPDEQDVAK